MAAPRSSKSAPARPDFFSHPSEEELLARYLLPRVSESKPCPFIHDADVYSLAPAELTNGFAPAVASNGDRAWYFFSAVRAKCREGHRRARTVDGSDGGWHSEAGARPVVMEPCQRRLGHRQSFSFVTKENGRRVRSGWLMVELGLDDGTYCDTVVCKIYFSPRAHLLGGAIAAARKRKAAADDDDDDSKNKNPAPRVHQKRLARATTTEAAAAPPHATDHDTACGGGGEAAGERDDTGTQQVDDAEGSLFLTLVQSREESLARGYVDRPDEEIRADLGLEEIYLLLDGAAEKRDELLRFPSYDDDDADDADDAGDSGYPVCLSWEELNSTEPLWFESYKRGYAQTHSCRR